MWTDTWNWQNVFCWLENKYFPEINQLLSHEKKGFLTITEVGFTYVTMVMREKIQLLQLLPSSTIKIDKQIDLHLSPLLTWPSPCRSRVSLQSHSANVVGNNELLALLGLCEMKYAHWVVSKLWSFRPLKTKVKNRPEHKQAFTVHGTFADLCCRVIVESFSITRRDKSM